MGGSAKKAVNKLGRNIKHIVGEKAYNITKQIMGVGGLQTTTKLLAGKSVRDSLSLGATMGLKDDLFEKPDMEESEPDKPSAVDTGALAAALEDEEEKRKKKKGFAANVFGSDFRFGGPQSGGTTGKGTGV